MDRNDISMIVKEIAPVVREYVSQATQPLLQRIAELEGRPAPANGKDGTNLTGGLIDQRGILILTLSDGKTVETGRIKGEDGNDGVPGADGSNGADGKDGAPGKDGANGNDGADGVNGKDGAHGADGKDIDLEAVRTAIAAEVADAVAGIPAGEKGEPGPAGKDASASEIHDIIHACVFRYLQDNPTKDGVDGKMGATGIDGKSVTLEELMPALQSEIQKAVGAIQVPCDGKDGKDGVGMGGAMIDRAGHLQVTLTDGSLHDLGPVVGKDASPEAVADIVKSEINQSLTRIESIGAGFDPDVLTDMVNRSVAELHESIQLPKDGIDGKDGAPGPAGEQGEPGLRGVDGTAGKPGENGEAGPAGKDGIAGKDGREGLDGADGRDGEPGKDGANGLDGKDGVPGVDGKDGAAGLDGKDGAAGLDGKDGAPGIDGRNGMDGAPGNDGADGLSGKDGIDGIDGKNIIIDDVRPLITGEVERSVAAIPVIKGEKGERGEAGRDGRDGLPGGPPGEKGEKGDPGTSLDYKEIYKPSHYEKGNAVTFGGSFWICMRDTDSKPGENDDWRLAVKRGRDGKPPKGGK